jgi:DNA replication regulator DPB11
MSRFKDGQELIPREGATYDEFLTEKSSILICNDPATKRDKLRFALKWGIPVVEPGWLWDCMRSGTQKSSHPHHIQPDAQVQTKDMTEEKRGEITAQVVDVERPKMRKRLPRTLRGSNSVDPGIETSESTSNGTNHETIDAHDTFQINDYDGLGSHDLAADAARKETSISTNLSTKDPPLQDVSTNSSSEKSTFPRDTSSNRDKSLSSDISSLLSLHRQRSESAVLSNTAQTNSSGVADPKNRRKRKLLGRAVSNLSVQSGLNVVGISRASSVDTLNTDGVGTPLEAIHPLPGGDETQALDDGISEARKALTAALLSTQGDIEHEQDHQALASAEFHPMMTQVAYDDPESGMWRERFLRKVGGAVVRDDKEKVQSKGKVAGTVKDSRDGDSVARRTRLASAR